MDTATGNRYIDSPGGLSGRGLIVPEPSGKLKAPDNIIMTVSAARTYWNQARMDHLDRIYLASQIIGLVGGNPPFDQEELAKAGLDHVTNANFLDAKALIERSALTLWNLINNNSYLIKFEIRPYQSQQDQDYTTWAETMSRKWTEVILEDGDKCVSKLGLDFNEVYKRTNTSYKPIPISMDGGMGWVEWFSDYKSASSVERVEAFMKLQGFHLKT